MSATFRKFHFDKQTTVFFLTVGLLAVIGIGLLLYSTPEGLGLNDDAVAYVAGARSLMNGDGYREAWLLSNGPMTQFPPGFPGMLALIGLITGMDPVRGARLLNGSLFGANIFLMGVLGWRMTKSRMFGVLASVLYLVTDSLLQIHSTAMSEPFYIFFTLVAIVLLYLYFEKERTAWLVALGIVVGLAYLTRYAALSLLATLVVVLFLLGTTWRKRFLSVLALLGSAVPIPILWSIRNRIEGGSYTNRVLGWHLITNENLQYGFRTFTDFLVPIQQWRKAIEDTPGLIEIILISLTLVLLTWLLIVGLRRFFKPQQTALPEIISFTNGLYIFGYLSALIATMTLFDAATRFQVRILSPVYPSFLLLFVAIAAWLWRRPQVAWKPVVTLVAIGVIVMFSYGEYQTVKFLHRGGQVYASWRWRDSAAIAYLQKLPPDVIILTNQPGVVYLYTDRPCGVLPYGSGIEPVKQEVLNGEVVFALFPSYRNDVESLKNYQTLTEGLYRHDFDGDAVFTAPPP